MKKIHVYSHTHWDYEWYFTANESIIQLIYHMDEVIYALQEGILKTYLLDSQVSILEEYLSFMPDKIDVVKKLVHDGKLQIGPWYTQSDELIIAGESMVRNLWYGRKYASTLGSCMNIGYLPDSFGQSKDMPKIYQGFDIKDALFWRGVPDDVGKQREFIWKSNDGSKVHVYNIRDGYFYGGNLIYNDDVKQVEEKISQGANGTHQLLPLGGDQRFVDFNLQERLGYYNQHTTQEYEYIESNLIDFFKELHKEDLNTMEGEFLDASVSKIHHSIYSTRYDHKQLNDRVERRLLYQLEPFMVMQMQLGIKPKVSVLESLWKKFLLNHAHDSACGCNSDTTNKSILQRLEDCDQMSSMMLDYQVRKLSESIKGIEDLDLIVYNTLPYTRKHIQTFEVNTKSKQFNLYDDDGIICNYDILSCEKVYAGSIRKDCSTYDPSLYYYSTMIRMSIGMKPMSIYTIHVKEQIEESVTVEEITSLENSAFSISFQNGQVHLYNKETKKVLKNFVYVEDGGDDGDTYDYSNPKEDCIYVLSFDDACVKYQGQHYPTMEIKGVWELPSNLKSREKQIRDVKIPYEFSIRLDKESLITCTLRIDNKAIEHRMRVVIKSDVQTSDSIADTAFGTIKRKYEDRHLSNWKERGYREEPTAIYPMLHHVSLADEHCCLTCFTKGIKEYQILEQKNIALTLFRSVPFLGKPDLLRRPGIASGNEFKYIETPDSCLSQILDFEFSMTFAKTYDANIIHKTWMNYANDFMYYQIQEMNRFVNTQKYFVTHPYKELDVDKASILSLDELTHASFSSLYPVDEHRFMLRIYNSENRKVRENRIQFNNVEEVTETNMIQRALHEHVLHDGYVCIGDMKCEEIKSYEIFVK